MRILAFYALILVFIVISLVLPMRFLECITSRYENFLVFLCILRCFYEKWQKMAKFSKLRRLTLLFRCGIITYIIIMKRKARFGRKFGLFTAFIEVNDSLTVAIRFCELEGNNQKG